MFFAFVVDVYESEGTAKITPESDDLEPGTAEDGVAFRRFSCVFSRFCGSSSLMFLLDGRFIEMPSVARW